MSVSGTTMVGREKRHVDSSADLIRIHRTRRQVGDVEQSWEQLDKVAYRPRILDSSLLTALILDHALGLPIHSTTRPSFVVAMGSTTPQLSITTSAIQDFLVTVLARSTSMVVSTRSLHWTTTRPFHWPIPTTRRWANLTERTSITSTRISRLAALCNTVSI